MSPICTVRKEVFVPSPGRNDEETPATFPNATRPGRVGGLLNFIGRWNASRGDYDWETSDFAWVPRRVSTRGLVETAVSQLANGNILLIARGSNVGLDPRGAG